MVSSSSRRPFEFVANHIVLDFINTVNGRPSFTRDDLGTPDDLVDWASAAGVISSDTPIGHRTGLAPQFEAAVAMREQLYAVFGPIALGGEPHAASLSSIGRRAGEAMPPARWQRVGAGYEPTWMVDSIHSLCDRLADAAVQLLRSPAVVRIRACDGCGWLFLDTSRAHGRRWCSMNACGVRHKMRRYHQRRAALAAAP